MRTTLPLLVLGLCLLSSNPSGSLLAQDHGVICGRPFPGPPAQRVPFSLIQGDAVLPDPGSTQFVSEEGRLCQQLSLSGSMAWKSQAMGVREPEPGKAFLLSALAPGAGQWFLGQDRWTPYLAAEIWAWSQFLQRRREGRNLQQRYRDLAWLVARRVSVGARVDADWDYYEALTKYHSSGAFDMDPQTPGIQPEQNPDTYNGAMWALAQALFFPVDPEAPVEEDSEPYRNALRYYMSRAYGPSLAWNWGGNLLHREEYGQLIRESDENFRSATNMIGIILANHLLSAVDALVSGRLQLLGKDQGHLEILIHPAPFQTYELSVRFRLATSVFHGR